jgi:hypothetical protein
MKTLTLQADVCILLFRIVERNSTLLAHEREVDITTLPYCRMCEL